MIPGTLALDARGASPSSDAMTTSLMFDVTRENFESEVVPQSANVPVLLDFWADWCEPCKSMGPVLERLLAKYGGAFVIGKIDTDQQSELAGLFMQRIFQVSSIPFFVLLKEGKPVDAFAGAGAGAVGEAEIENFLGKHGIQPIEGGESEDGEPTPEAILTDGRRAAMAGDATAVREALAAMPEGHDLAAEATRLLEGLEWLETELTDTPSPAGVLLEQGRTHLRAGDLKSAMETLLAALAADKDHAKGLGRRAMLLCFSLAGEDSEATEQFRRRMATVLF